MKMGWASGLPEAWRLLSISFMPKRMLGMASVSAILCILILAFTLVLELSTPGYSPEKGILYTLAYCYFIYHAILLWIYIPSVVCLSITREWRDKTWVFQQVTPQSPLKLSLGKLLGAPGDAYIALIVSFPFLFFSILFSQVSVFIFLVGYFLALFVGISLGILNFYLGTQLERANKGDIGNTLLPPILLFIFLLLILAGIDGTFPQSSVFHLNPFSIFMMIFHDKTLLVSFFHLSLPMPIAVILFCSIWGIWFFTASSAQLSRRMSMYSSRLPLVALFLWMAILIVGFIEGSHLPLNEKIVEFQVMLLITTFLLMLYGVMIIHARSLQEIRPWLYQWEKKPGSIFFFFRTDSPVIFTVLILLVTAILILTAIHGDLLTLTGKSRELKGLAGKGKLNLFQMMVMFSSVIIRDGLFIQVFRMNQKSKRDWPLALIYFVTFFAIPYLVDLFFQNYIVDLTPFAIFFHQFVPGSGFAWQTVIFINCLFIALLGYLNWRMISKAYKHLPPELQTADRDVVD